MKDELTPEQETRVQALLNAGSFADANDVIAQGLELVRQKVVRARIDAALDKAEADRAAGRVYRWTPELREQIRREGDEMFLAGVVPDPDVCP